MYEGRSPTARAETTIPMPSKMNPTIFTAPPRAPQCAFLAGTEPGAGVDIVAGD